MGARADRGARPRLAGGRGAAPQARRRPRAAAAAGSRRERRPPSCGTSSRTGIGRVRPTADVLARRDTVQARAARRAREPVLDGSVLRVGPQWVAIPPARVPVVALLLTRRGEVVRPAELVAAVAAGGGSSDADRGAGGAPPPGQDLCHRRPAAAQRAGSGLAARGAARADRGRRRGSRRHQMQQRRKKGAVQASADLGAAVPVTKHWTKHLGSNLARVFPTDKELMWRSIPGTPPGC